MIAVWDGNRPTCKVFKTFEHYLELQSANPEFPPIVLDQGTEVEVPIEPQPVTCQQRKAQAARRDAPGHRRFGSGFTTP
ncbi:S24 family peptidase [Stenotrophomonas rhizophila]|uniref:S24 family peptidase n=1 Tax=Stenotrophomonas rhizophila TaxID=216778 RepID=UPI0028AA04A8|nr:S24 family peptidase [Stenotrophomonas rhizophila]